MSTSKRELLYVLRTDSLSSESRVSKLFGALQDRDCLCHVVGLVKRKSDFEYPNTQQVCWSEKIRWSPARHLCKFVELQFRLFLGVLRHPVKPNVIVIANYDLLIAGIILRVLFRRKVFVDLHEHYVRRLFRHHWFSRVVFTRLFSGVIFANHERAMDFMGDSASDSIAIVRNFPATEPGVVEVSSRSSDRDSLRIGIVGGFRPGRFVLESIDCLDREENTGRIEIWTFGPKAGVNTRNVDLIEHGWFRHDEIDGLIQSIDVSLVFYDPQRSANNLFCEPNRYYQSYNAGKILISFEHSSLSMLQDAYCIYADSEKFESSLLAIVEKLLVDRQNVGQARQSVERKKLVFDDGVFGLDLLLVDQ